VYAVSKLVQVTDAEGLSLQQVVDGMLQAVLPVLPFLQGTKSSTNTHP
jgi:hypothetical protein